MYTNYDNKYILHNYEHNNYNIKPKIINENVIKNIKI